MVKTNISFCNADYNEKKLYLCGEARGKDGIYPAAILKVLNLVNILQREGGLEVFASGFN